MKKHGLRPLLAIVLSSAIASMGTAASTTVPLTMTDFMAVVEQQNGSYVASSQKANSLTLRGDEYLLYARPSLIAGAEHTKDARLTGAPAFQGTETNTKSYFLGVQQTTNFGLDAALTYKYVDTSIMGTNPTFFPQPHYIIASPVLELNQSLWRNWAGRQVSAKREAMNAQTKADQLNEQYNLIRMKSDAETAYWKLVVARKMVNSAKGNTERAERINSWYTKRSDMQLSDQSDSLQGKAILAARKLELEAALAEERAAARAFNMMRGSDQEDVTESLDELKYETIMNLKAPERQGMRKDIQAAAEQAKADRAKAIDAEESASADVKAYANLSLNGRNPQARTTVDQSFSNNYPMTMVGVKLDVPLSFGVASATRQGYRVQAESSDIIYKRKMYENERLWMDLSRKFEDAKNRLSLAIELEKAQQKKVDFEKTRRGRGRSTTIQVIQFEQDYASAQVSRINLESEIINLHAQLKTFGGAQ